MGDAARQRIVFLTEAAAAVQRARVEAKLLMVFLHGDFDGDVHGALAVGFVLLRVRDALWSMHEYKAR
jgi:hypothetical protein